MRRQSHRFSPAERAQPPWAALVLAGALAALAGCGSSGPPCARGGSGGAGGSGAAGGKAGLSGDAMVTPGDAGLPDRTPDAAPPVSCVSDGGATCIDFDPGYPSPAGVCALQSSGAVVNAPCPSQGSAGGCHITQAHSGYIIWSYAPATVGATMARCQQLGDSYLSPPFE